MSDARPCNCPAQCACRQFCGPSTLICPCAAPLIEPPEPINSEGRLQGACDDVSRSLAVYARARRALRRSTQ